MGVTAEHLTTSSAARILRVAEGTVRLMEKRGELPAIRLSNGMRVFLREDVERLRCIRSAGK
jgi:excisionase family DNA binding protein